MRLLMSWSRHVAHPSRKLLWAGGFSGKLRLVRRAGASVAGAMGFALLLTITDGTAVRAQTTPPPPPALPASTLVLLASTAADGIDIAVGPGRMDGTGPPLLVIPPGIELVIDVDVTENHNTMAIFVAASKELHTDIFKIPDFRKPVPPDPSLNRADSVLSGGVDMISMGLTDRGLKGEFVTTVEIVISNNPSRSRADKINNPPDPDGTISSIRIKQGPEFKG